MTSSCGIWDFRRQIDGAKSTSRFGSRDGAVSFAVQRSHAARPPLALPCFIGTSPRGILGFGVSPSRTLLERRKAAPGRRTRAARGWLGAGGDGQAPPPDLLITRAKNLFDLKTRGLEKF